MHAIALMAYNANLITNQDVAIFWHVIKNPNKTYDKLMRLWEPPRFNFFGSICLLMELGLIKATKPKEQVPTDTKFKVIGIDYIPSKKDYAKIYKRWKSEKPKINFQKHHTRISTKVLYYKLWYFQKYLRDIFHKDLIITDDVIRQLMSSFNPVNNTILVRLGPHLYAAGFSYALDELKELRLINISMLKSKKYLSEKMKIKVLNKPRKKRKI